MPLYDPYGRPATGPISPEEVERLFQDSTRKVQENTRAMVEGIEKVTQAFEKNVARMEESLEKQLERSQENFRQIANTLGRGVAETMQRSLRMGMPSTLNSVQPLFGKIGEDLGGMAGQGIANMLGKGGVWGVVASTVGKLVVNELSMQAEGFQMIGARVAPVATAGRNLNVDFAEVGAKYVRAIRDVSRATGATADEVANLADKLSKVGVGFLEGGEKEVQFALAAERVMNLSRGTAEALQTETITKYGESIEDARENLIEIRNAQREFIAINWQTNSSISRTLSSGQTLVDLLGQISSAGRNSGASLRDMNNLASALVKTMATQPGGPMFRPGQMAEVGANLMQNVLPSMSSTMQEEAQKSKLDEMIMGQTAYGKQVMDTIKKSSPDYLKHASGPNFLFNMQQQAFVASKGRGAGMEVALSKLAGISKIFATPNQSPEATFSLLEQRGYTPAASAAALKIMDDLKQRGFNPDNPQGGVRVLKDYMKEAQSDPRIRDRIKQAGLERDMYESAEEQGRAMLSTMENIANILMDVRLFTQDYWNKWKNTTAEVFGLSRNDPWYKSMAAALTRMPKTDPGGISGAAQAGSLARFGFTNPRLPAKTPPPPAPNIRTDQIVISRDTARATQSELQTDKGVTTE